MKTGPEKPETISQEDWDAVDVSEATSDEFARAIPFRDAFPAHFAAWEQSRRGETTARKARLSLRLSADVIGGIKATGPGYGRRIEEVLRRALAKGELSGP